MLSFSFSLEEGSKAETCSIGQQQMVKMQASDTSQGVSIILKNFALPLLPRGTAEILNRITAM